MMEITKYSIIEQLVDEHNFLVTSCFKLKITKIIVEFNKNISFCYDSNGYIGVLTIKWADISSEFKQKLIKLIEV